jgi:sugar phosphate isomerase/epimerase
VKLHQVALQLYTLREFLKTPAEIAATLKRVRAIGYQAVQISGLGAIAEEDLVKILAGEGLVCCGTHEPGEMILEEPQRVVERLRKLNTQITAYPFPAGVNFDTLESIKSFCRQLDAAGKVLHDAGLVLCYHNHHIEFRRVAGRTVLEIIYAETKFVQGEPDTYWIQNGGGDPVEWCDRLKGRLPIIHLKDYAVTADNKITYAEIGSGNLHWKKIITAAEAAGCQWYCVEQDACPGDPFVSVKQSFEFIRDNLCSA